jgi:aryl sulfotransferase
MTDLPARTRDYVTPVFDSRRWDHYRPRSGDIVVATPAKSGTTWTQMICAMLVHGTPKLPKPLTQLSRWLDRYTIPIEKLTAELEAQPHARVIKTHTPLDGLPYHADVRYVVCGRDARDAFLSLMDHFENLSPETLADLARRMGQDEAEVRAAPEANMMFPIWATTGLQPWVYDGAPFGVPQFYTIESFWRFRHLPNIYFLHYADLMRDLEGEMRRLAAWLGYEVAEAEWPAMVRAASFDTMKSGAGDAAPDADKGEWRRPDDFFRSARMEAWRTGLSADNQALYEQVNAARLDPEMKAWVEGGRTVVTP